jgi:hypothetical protein
VQGAEENELMRQFKEAAERLRLKRECEGLPPEGRIVRQIRRYMAEWKIDLDARPKEFALTTVGLQVSTEWLSLHSFSG